MVARCSRDSWDEAAGVAAQAQAIRDRAVVLAHTDGKVWEDALAALGNAQAKDASDARRDFALEQKLERAAAAPLEIAELGADVAALAALAGVRPGDERLARARASQQAADDAAARLLGPTR